MSNPGSPTSAAAPSSSSGKAVDAATPLDPPRAVQSPTIHVHYGTRTVKARVDREVPLAEIVRQLAASSQLAVSEPPALFALREKETGELVTDDNLSKMLDRGLSFTLCSSPLIEAAEIVEKLNGGEPAVIKLATFSLRNLIKERAFLGEFLARGGLEALQEVIQRSTGNTLAYSLLSLQNLLDLEDGGWEGLSPQFAARIVEIIAKEPLINICRPATAILRRLSMHAPVPFVDRDDAPSSPTPSTPGNGFAAVYREIQKQPDFMKIVVGRLSSGDMPIATLSLGLINSLFRGAIELGDGRLGDELEALDAWKTIGKLLETRKDTDLTPILTFQAHLVASLHQTFITRVDEDFYPLFDDIWAASEIKDAVDSYRWRRLGFRTESPQYEFDGTGVLGLKALARYAGDSQNEFATSLKEGTTRPEARRCPLAAVSATVLLSLAEHFDVTQGVSQSPTTPSPFLFRFYECHALATQFFLRIWIDSGATQGDFDRVATLATSQIDAVLGGAGLDKTWFKVRQEFLHAEYKAVRDRQMREMEIEDDILSKAPVRSLRGRLYLESFEFVRNQRISCLHEGAWFLVPGAVTGKKSQAQKTWRFYRLAANRKALHYVETSDRIPLRGGLDDLPDKIDLALVTDVVAANAALTSGRRSQSTNPRQSIISTHSTSTITTPSASSNPSSLAFSLLSAEGVVAELIAPDQATYSEWLDGLSLLRSDGNISTKDTADYVHTLTEIGVKVKLLDLSGEKVDIPSQLSAGPVPRSTDFFYADLG